MKNKLPSRIAIILVFLNLLLLCSCSKKLAPNHFQVIVKANIEANALSMYPSQVQEKFLDATYTFLYHDAVVDGRIHFKGSKPSYPVMFDFLVQGEGLSDKFFVENGTTELTVDFKNSDQNVFIAPSNMSQAQKEYEILKSQGLKAIEKKYEESDFEQEKAQLLVTRDSLITNFVSNNPNSFVPLWLMINNYAKQGSEYNERYDLSLDKFSKEIQKTELFKRFNKALKDSKNLSFENKELVLKNMNLEEVTFNTRHLSNVKFILLDFWFSECTPCLKEMSQYTSFYETYKNKGFEIVSISTDGTKKIDKWKSTITSKGYNWIHYLDENGKETSELNIFSFPTTYLVTPDGEIIMKDVNAEKLEEFLRGQFD
ncbi:MAG: TlpA family protein disulfide reductase [Nonlabens sp.]|nr:TlpA family protein disulfide reductase [Nonlabens sp.]